MAFNFNFGATQSQPTTSSFGFGAKPAATTGTSTSFGFGASTSTAAPAASTGFGFGAPAKPATTTTSGFGFGAPAATSASTTSGFGFGTSAPAATTSSWGGGFGFGKPDPAKLASDEAAKRQAELARQAAVQQQADNARLVALVTDDPYGLNLSHAPSAEEIVHKALEQQRRRYGVIAPAQNTPIKVPTTTTTLPAVPSTPQTKLHSHVFTPQKQTPVQPQITPSTFLSPGHGFPQTFQNEHNEGHMIASTCFASPHRQPLLSSPQTVNALHNQIELSRQQSFGSPTTYMRQPHFPTSP